MLNLCSQMGRKRAESLTLDFLQKHYLIIKSFVASFTIMKPAESIKTKCYPKSNGTVTDESKLCTNVIAVSFVFGSFMSDTVTALRIT